MFISTMQTNATPAFRVTINQPDVADILGEITLYLTNSTYLHMTVDQAVQLRAVLRDGILSASAAKAEREVAE